MKFINLNSTKRTLLATAAILIVGLLSILPWRAIAQTSSNTPPAAPTTAGSRGAGGFYREESLIGLIRAATPAPINIAPARFEATIYELALPSSRIADLDTAKLEAAAATPQSLASAIEPFGTAKILYKVDQMVNLNGEEIAVSAIEPLVTSTRTNNFGARFNGITYQEAGFNARIFAIADGSKSAEPKVQVTLQLSRITSSGVEISDGVEASRTRTVRLNQSGTPKFGKPTVILTVNAGTAYVVRYVFTRP